jgi:uncharacterized protein (TIGR02217 family)
MAFMDKRFPVPIGRRSSGGPERRTQIVTTTSGREQRNQLWADSRRSYMAGTGLRSLGDIETLVAFFEEMRGRFHSFRFRDPADHMSCGLGQTPSMIDQMLGTGDGTKIIFQLIKRYGAEDTGWDRDILLPVADTVLIALDGVLQTVGYAIDHMTGQVTFDVAPPSGISITAGFSFDVPVRFDADRLEIDLEAFAAGSIPDVPLIEVRL